MKGFHLFIEITGKSGNKMLGIHSTYFLFIGAFVYLLIAIFNLKLGQNNREILIFFAFLLIIAMDLLLKTREHELYTISLTFSFFMISSLSFKKVMDKPSNFIENYSDYLIFLSFTTLIAAIFLLTRFKFITNTNILSVSIFIYQLVALLIFLVIFTKYYESYIFAINFNIKLLLFLYMITFFLISFNYSFNRLLIVYYGDQIAKFSFIFLLNNFLIYTFLMVFSLIKIGITINTLTTQLFDLRTIKKNEFKMLNIIRTLVLKNEEFEPTLESILEIACKFTKSDGGILFLYNEDEDEFYGKKIHDYVIPPFFVNEKLLENGDQINRIILSKRFRAEDHLFQSIINQEGVICVSNDVNDTSREYLRDLHQYAENIGALLAGKIMVDGKLFGIIVLERLFSNYSQDNVNSFRTICNFSSVLIKNINAKQLAKEKDRLTNEMKIAEQIQTSILPKNYSIPEYAISAMMKPADEVGGDYYDIITGPDDNYWLNIGDVTGHGVTAGLIMMMLQTVSLTTINNIPGISPKDLFINCNSILCHNIKDRLLLDQFITACFFKFNKDGTFSFSGAHEDILIYRHASKEVEIIETKGVWLGLLEDIEEQTQLNSFKLEKNDVLLIFTDGVIELSNEYDEQYDIKRLVNFLKVNGKNKPEDISRILMQELETFKNEQKDDITFIVAKKE